MAIKQKKKILIIEDEKLLLEMYQTYFKKAGYDVIVADNGLTGIQKVKLTKPDLIIVDILIPGQSGYVVIKKIRREAENSKTPILAFSNLGQLKEINQGMISGADSYVVKTDITPAELLDKVERMIAISKHKTHGKRLLIIDDKTEIAQKCKLILSKDNIKVKIAKNTEDGLRWAGYGDFNAILLNVSLIRGYETLKWLKDDFRTHKIPVLVLSESSQEEDISQALQMGAKKYFIKSKISIDIVINEIKNILVN